MLPKAVIWEVTQPKGTTMVITAAKTVTTLLLLVKVRRISGMVV